VRSRFVQGSSDIAIVATITQSALRTAAAVSEEPVELALEDVRHKIRSRHAPVLVLLLVDASWSMVAEGRMELVKGAVLDLLSRAYRRRYRVGLVTFRGSRAELRLAPTNAVTLARRALSTMPVGGTTPLASGLAMAANVIRRERMRGVGEQRIVLAVLSDGESNVSTSGRDIQSEVLMWGRHVSTLGVEAIVIDTARRRGSRERLNALVAAMRARLLVPDGFTRSELVRLVGQATRGL